MDKRQKSFIAIDSAKCIKCRGLVCVGVCPQGALEEGKNQKPEVIDSIQCTRCGVCADLCPAKAITISKS